MRFTYKGVMFDFKILIEMAWVMCGTMVMLYPLVAVQLGMVNIIIIPCIVIYIATMDDMAKRLKSSSSEKSDHQAN